MQEPEKIWSKNIFGAGSSTDWLIVVALIIVAIRHCPGPLTDMIVEKFLLSQNCEDNWDRKIGSDRSPPPPADILPYVYFYAQSQLVCVFGKSFDCTRFQLQLGLSSLSWLAFVYLYF